MFERPCLLVEAVSDGSRREVEDELRAPEMPPCVARLGPLELAEKLPPGDNRGAMHQILIPSF